MVALTHTKDQVGKSSTFAFAAFGLVVAPATALVAGGITAVYFTDGLRWLGLVLAAGLVAAATWLAARKPATGITAGIVLALIMLVFAVTGVGPESRPVFDFGGVLLFGGAGLLTAALCAAFLASAIVSSRARRTSV
jgi:hypothetical protein